MRLKQQVAVVTGAGQGIGLATATRFAREGATVICCDIRQDGVDRAVAACLEASGGDGPRLSRSQGGPAPGHEVALAGPGGSERSERGGTAHHEGIALDVTNRVAVDAMAQAVLARHGQIDILVNNAGITKDARLQRMTIEQFDAVIDINLRGVFHCTQAVVDAMVARGRGSILNASSVVGIYGNFGQTNYAASKFGVIGFTKTWSRELGPKGIRVNAVAPGFIETPILGSIPDKVLDGMRERVPMQRLGRPDEVASVYAFLASDEASYVNGAVIEVSGGMTV